jgi:hypothetical protein
MWYNTSRGRSGTLWEERFRSVLVEGGEHALMTMAAYIELNAVRGGLAEDPKDYRWCGYGEAVAGRKLAQANLARMHARTRVWQVQGKGHREGIADGRDRDGAPGEGDDRSAVSWREAAAAYRRHLFGQGVRRLGDGRTGRGARPGIDPAKVEAVIGAQGGELPLHELLRCRVRYFSDGAVLGSRAFVEGVFESRRGQFGARRKTGARNMRGADWGGLTTLRDLRGRVFG